MSATSTKRGKFITVEGQDGAGKTTHLTQLESIIRVAGYQVLRTREPGGTPLGDEIRQLVLYRRSLRIDAIAELLLIFAARSQHLAAVIRPALEAGTWVVCDRFTDATYAYQGGGRGVGNSLISELEQRVQEGLRPDLTLLFDVDIPTGVQRTGGSMRNHDRFESEEEAFKDRVRSTYLSRARAEPQRIRTIDAGQALEQVSKEVESHLQQYIESLS